MNKQMWFDSVSGAIHEHDVDESSAPKILSYTFHPFGSNARRSPLWLHFFGAQDFVPPTAGTVYRYMYLNRLYIDMYVVTALTGKFQTKNSKGELDIHKVMPNDETRYAYALLSDSAKVVLVDHDINGASYAFNNPWFGGGYGDDEDGIFEDFPDDIVFLNPNTFDCWNDFIKDYGKFQAYLGKEWSWLNVPMNNVWFTPLTNALKRHLRLRTGDYVFKTTTVRGGMAKIDKRQIVHIVPRFEGNGKELVYDIVMLAGHKFTCDRDTITAYFEHTNALWEGE